MILIKKGYKYLINNYEEEIKKLYLEDMKTKNKIAEHYDCSMKVINRVFKELSIPIRKKSEYLKLSKTSKLDSMIGNKYHKLTILKRDSLKTNNVIVNCDCGNKNKSTNGYAILRNKTKSCGCLSSESNRKRNIENTKHGLSNHKLYHVHNKMKLRCYNENNKHYKYYGAKGVSICDEWLGEKGLETFYKWAISNGYKEGLTIDRIDNEGNYEPSNCRWITLSENVAKRNFENSKKYKKLKGGI